jgi:hypothetical protein
VFPLVKNQEFDDAAKVIAKALTTAGISHIIDTTGTCITSENNCRAHCKGDFEIKIPTN